VSTRARWDRVAQLQKDAWVTLKKQNPDYVSSDVEQITSWRIARALADNLLAMEQNSKVE